MPPNQRSSYTVALGVGPGVLRKCMGRYVMRSKICSGYTFISHTTRIIDSNQCSGYTFISHTTRIIDSSQSQEYRVDVSTI